MANQINAFFDLVLTSSLMDVLWEYSTETVGIGRGRRLPSFNDVSQPGNPISDAQLQQALQNWIANGKVPATTANTLYFIFLPPNVAVTDPTGEQSCVVPNGFCGYHSHIGGNIFYAIVPYIGGTGCTGCHFGGAGDFDAITGVPNVFDSITKAIGHELAEAVTDPALNAWFDPNSKEGEIGDICNDNTTNLPDAQGRRYFVQTEWSNIENNCILAPISPPWSHPAAAADRLSNDVDNIVVANNQDGRLEVFMRGHNDGHLYHKWQTAPNTNNWSHPVGAADRLSNDVSWFAVAQNQDGRLEVFMRGHNDGHLYHKWQAPGGGWSHPVGAADRLSLNVGQFAVAQNQDGRLEVFMRGTNDGHLYHKWQTAPNINNWAPSGEAAADRLSNDVSWVEVGRNRDGRLEVFMRGTNDGHLYHKWQTTKNTNNWSHPVGAAARLSRDVDGTWPLLIPGRPQIDFADAPRGFVVANNQDGRLEVFVRGSNDGHLYHKWQAV
jgi:hypothetical protein